MVGHGLQHQCPILRGQVRQQGFGFVVVSWTRHGSCCRAYPSGRTDWKAARRAAGLGNAGGHRGPDRGRWPIGRKSARR
jgi:hypothetical protein